MKYLQAVIGSHVNTQTLSIHANKAAIVINHTGHTGKHILHGSDGKLTRFGFNQ